MMFLEELKVTCVGNCHLAYNWELMKTREMIHELKGFKQQRSNDMMPWQQQLPLKAENNDYFVSTDKNRSHENLPA